MTPGQLPYPAMPVQQGNYPYPPQGPVPGQSPYPNQSGTPTPTVPQAVTNAIFNPSATGRSAFGNPQPSAGGMGGGIAGVGLPAEMKGEGIMVVKDRSKYREWEFIYDPKEDKNIVGAAAAAQNAGAGGPAPNPLGPQRTNP